MSFVVCVMHHALVHLIFYIKVKAATALAALVTINKYLTG